MLHKESAIAVMVAVMLAGASIFGGFSVMPALATNDPEAVQIANRTISQADEESRVIDSLELTAKKSTSRATGTVTIEIIQDDEVLRSTTLKTSSLNTFLSDIEAQVSNINVTGSFEVRVEYEGSGVVTVTNIEVVETTEPAEEEPSNGGDGDDNNGSETPEQELENVIASKILALASDETMTIETVEFSAKKSTSRASGTVTVAIVQDDEVLETEQITTKELTTILQDMEVSFDDLEVTDDFEVVFMYDGSGVITIRNIDVPGATEPAEEEPTTTPNPDGSVTLIVNAVDESGNEITGMWIEVYEGTTPSGEPAFEGDTPETFELEAGQYVVAVADFESNVFLRWADSAHDRTREATLTEDETFTAVYSTNGAPPPTQEEPTTSPPAGSEPGTITAYAYRIPSSHWGPTFVSANAQMWFVLYNATGWIVHSGYYDERGSMVNGLNEGETYYIYATDCNQCHEDPHDVVFRHWEDSSTANPRTVTTGMSVGAYYEYVPPS